MNADIGSANPDHQPEIFEAAYNEVFQTLSSRSVLIPLPVIIAAAMLMVIGWNKVDSFLLVVGGLLVCAQSVARIVALKILTLSQRFSSRQRLDLLALVNLCGALLQCLGLALFPLANDAERSVLTILGVGMSVGTVALSLGYRPAYLSYVIPMMGSLSFCWFYFPSAGLNPVVSIGMAVLILFLAVIMHLMGSATFTNLLDAMASRNRQAALNTKLRTALDRAETANRAKTRFLASASHDLRQPLHTLSMFSAALQMRPLDPRSAEIARNIDVAMQELSTELDSLLDISKLDAGVIQANPATFRLNEVFQSLQRIYEPIASERGLSLLITTDDSISVKTDRALFERVLRNIVDNAIKYSETGTITIDANLSDNGPNLKARITIRDQGIGIDEKDLIPIFDEFYQIANPERNRAKGLGLGLAIVQRLCHLLDISIAVRSLLGTGSTFNLSMPAQQTQAVNQPSLQQSMIATLAGKTILILDDEQSVRDSMLAVLTEAKCIVYTAATTVEAVAQIQCNRPDIVLADLRLQGDSNGIAAIKQLRQLCPGLPAILISGDTEPRQIQAADKAQITMLHKPVDLETLARAVAHEL